MEPIKRIHHISAIVGHPQETIDFYRDVLGFRLIKQTVNFDDTNVYHLYFGKPDEEPAAAMTFFNWTTDATGVVGSGQVGRIAFRIPKGTMTEWKKHLEDHGVQTRFTQLFGKNTLEFTDTHNLALALVEGEETASDQKIQGFHGTILLSRKPGESADDLKNFIGLTKVADDGKYVHFETAGEERHRVLVLKNALPARRLGVGTVHHVAWAVEDDEELAGWKEVLTEKEYPHTDMRDRNYFHSVYYREPGSITIEFATAGPGFTVDEPLENLGQKLQLPEQYEHMRSEFEANLPEINV